MHMGYDEMKCGMYDVERERQEGMCKGGGLTANRNEDCNDKSIDTDNTSHNNRDDI